jgi:pyruvate dehydrogenase E1 component alpha subunit
VANRFNTYTIVIGAQTLHATGYAMGVAKDGKIGDDDETSEAVIAYFGDGATSQGDVNEAFIFGSVYNAPIVFFCQNNQYAISEPLERQSASTLPARSAWLPRRPRRRQRRARLLRGHQGRAAAGPRGQRPDARRGVHLPDGCAHHHRRPDPLPALLRRRGLEAQGPDRAREGLPGPQRPGRRGFFDEVEEEAERLGEHLRAGCKALPEPDPLSIFDHVYVDQTPELAAQKEGFAAYLASFEGHKEGAR